MELIKPSKPEYKLAFFFRLRRTLVAKDMDQATRIGLQGKTRWRVVTLQGGLIDVSGTMSGGGHHVAQGGMRASLCQHSPEEVMKMMEECEKVNNELTRVRQQRNDLQEALQLADKETAECELREKKCEMEIKSLHQQIEAYEARLNTMKVPTLSSNEKQRLKELEKTVSSKSNELHEIHAKKGAVEEEVRELHNQIMNIGGEELKTAKWEVEEAEKKCEELRRYMKTAVLDAENMDKNAKKAETDAKKAKDDEVIAQLALAVLREEHAKLEDRAEVVLNSYRTLKENLVEKDAVLTKLRQKRDELFNEASALKNQEVDLVQEMEEKAEKLRKLQANASACQHKLEQSRAEFKNLPLNILHDLREAKGDDGAHTLDQELARKAIEKDLCGEELSKVTRANVEARLLVLEQNLKNLKPNLTAIEEFRRAAEEHKIRLSDYECANTKREDARRALEDLRKQRLDEFMDGFCVISMKLKEMYQMITLGGDAELELVDTLDPFNEGINFSVRPPKKSWKQITNLSGGEKTLASLSLVFALHHYKPTPLYFMDEIDAALDFRNVSIIANYIKERTKNAQFIVISLRNHMFELADLLVGIYKTYDVSKSVAINPAAFEVKKNALQNNAVNIDVSRSIVDVKPMPENIHVTQKNAGKENAM